MKRLFCLVICLTLCLPAVFADEVDVDLSRRFNAQFITGGAGVRGKATITASGTADWLDFVLPFTAADLQIRAIGLPQGGQSDAIDDDDAWQVQLYTQDGSGNKKGTTWLHSAGKDVCLTSELLPDITLKLPSQGVHLLYDLARKDVSSILFGFDLFGLKDRTENGRPAVYENITDIIGVDDETWTNDWASVLQKYELDMDLWLTGYAQTTSAMDEKGLLTMTTVYNIPADAVKEQAKHLVGQMIFDNDLQNLLVPLVTPEERSIYLNPNLVYFYEAIIDALPLNGYLTLQRNVNARGEVLGTEVSLPLPPLPETLTAPVNEWLAQMLKVPYRDALAGLQRISWSDTGAVKSLSLICDKRTLTLAVQNQSAAEDGAVTYEGTIQIVPAIGVNEAPLFANFRVTAGHRVYESEDYRIHDVTSFALEMYPDQSLNSGIQFDPFAVAYSADYHTKANAQDAPVQINIDFALDLADAEVSATVLLRTMSGWEHTELSEKDAIDVRLLTEEQMTTLRALFVQNAEQMMRSLAAAVSEPTAVPPVNQGGQ